MGKIGCFREYINQIRTDVLPKSVINEYGYNRVGQYLLRQGDLQKLSVATENCLYGHEKASLDRVGIRSKFEPEKYLPSYVKYFDDTIITSLEKTIASSALNIYPTPLQVYGVTYETGSSNSLGVATIDLNGLKCAESGECVDSIRLDVLLNKIGFPCEIGSYYQFQEMIKSGKLGDWLTPRALVQLGLSKIFIPNAIGETDPNSSNVILLKEKSSNKYDIVVRIDAEKNEYLLDSCGVESENVVTTGFLGMNEPLLEYLNIIKSRDARIDWELFSGFVSVAKDFCSRSCIDEAVTKSYISNPHKFDPNTFLRPSDYIRYYDSQAFADFSEYAIGKSKNYFDNILNSLGGVAFEAPFADKYSGFLNMCIDSKDCREFVQCVYDKTGMEI